MDTPWPDVMKSGDLVHVRLFFNVHGPAAGQLMQEHIGLLLGQSPDISSGGRARSSIVEIIGCDGRYRKLLLASDDGDSISVLNTLNE